MITLITYRQGYLDAVREVAQPRKVRLAPGVLDAWAELVADWMRTAPYDAPPPKIADALALVRSRVPPDEPTLTQSKP